MIDIKNRDKMISEIASNRVLSGTLSPEGRRDYLAALEALDDICLELELEYSETLLGMSLEISSIRSKN